MVNWEAVESSEDDVKPMGSRRRERALSSGTEENKRGVRQQSVEFNGVEFEDDGADGVDEDVISEVESEVDSEGGADNIWAEREIDAGEDAAFAARERAQMERTSADVGQVSDGVDLAQRAKRKRSLDSEDASDVEQEDSLVPFQVIGFCQGCRCKQNISILGEVKRRRAEEVDQMLSLMGKHYKVLLRRGETKV